MRFTVTWDDEAAAELTKRWLTSSSHERSHLNWCVNHIDAALRENAHQKGAVLKQSGSLRYYSAPVIPARRPVGVVYAAILDDRLVKVLELWVLSES